MERLLRTLFTVRGLILAGTLMLAAVGSYLDQGTAALVVGVNSRHGSPVHAAASRQIPAQQNTTVLCTPAAPTYVALPCS